MNTTPQHAVVTGGGTGIGKAVAQQLSQQGFKLTLMGRHRDTLDAVAEALPQAQAILCDVGQEDDVQNAFAQAAKTLGPVSVLVNNAGVASSAPLHKMSLEQFRRVLDVNVLGVFLCTRAVLPAMLKTASGRIVNVASVAGLEGHPYLSAYAASKHAVVGMTKCLALETCARGVTVNAVCPGYTETEMAKLAIDTVVQQTGLSPAQARETIVRVNPQGRMIQPAEVADTVAWLCSPAASAITGQAIVIA